MVSLGAATTYFAIFLAAWWGYWRLYFRPRLYLYLLGDRDYREHYLMKLPHLAERPDERQGMIAYLEARRTEFFRVNRLFALSVGLLYLALLFLAGR